MSDRFIETPWPTPLVPSDAWRDDGDGGREAEVMGYHLWVERLAADVEGFARDVYLPTIWTYDRARPIFRLPVSLIRRPTYAQPRDVAGPASIDDGQALADEMLRGWLATRDEATRASYEALPPEAQEALRGRRTHWAMPLAGRLACGGPLAWTSWTRDRTATLAYEANYACPVCRVAALLDQAEELEAIAARARAQAHDTGRDAHGVSPMMRQHVDAIDRMTRADVYYWTERLWRTTKYGQGDER